MNHIFDQIPQQYAHSPSIFDTWDPTNHEMMSIPEPTISFKKNTPWTKKQLAAKLFTLYPKMVKNMSLSPIMGETSYSSSGLTARYNGGKGFSKKRERKGKTSKRKKKKKTTRRRSRKR